LGVCSAYGAANTQIGFIMRIAGNFDCKTEFKIFWATSPKNPQKQYYDDRLFLNDL